MHWTKAAQKNIEFDSYFGGPVVFGPIVVGTIAGSGGSFFFRDGRTLLALENKNVSNVRAHSTCSEEYESTPPTNGSVDRLCTLLLQRERETDRQTERVEGTP